MAAGLAISAAALAAAAPRSDDARLTAAEPAGPATAEPHPKPGRAGQPLVSAPVRIADAASVRLLRPGDRVDVVAAGDSDGTAAGRPAKVVARAAKVTQVPREQGPSASAEAGFGTGALVVLSVPRRTATALAGAGASGRLAVSLC